MVYYIVAKNTIEEGIEGVIASKRALRQSVLTSSIESDEQLAVAGFMDYLKKDL